jgi:hypothetical protein
MSKNSFTVGHSSIKGEVQGWFYSNRWLNDLMINTNAENYIVFTHEIFRYLKILNKL